MYTSLFWARLFYIGLSIVLKTSHSEQFSNFALSLVLHSATPSSHGCSLINWLHFSPIMVQQERNKSSPRSLQHSKSHLRLVAEKYGYSEGEIWNRIGKLYINTFLFFFLYLLSLKRGKVDVKYENENYFTEN